MNHFCTCCDQGYAARLLCLHESLLSHGEPFVLHVLCFDAATFEVVRADGRPSLVAYAWDEVLGADPEYAAVRDQRSRVEMYFTSTPVFVRHCLQRVPGTDAVTYVDADLYFFGPASGVFAVQGDASVGIVPHRFPDRLRHLERHGVYNVAWVSFRRDVNGLAAVEWWRARCLEWCGDVVEDGRYADQGYLNEFPGRFANVRVLDGAGINAAPWNMDDAIVATDGGALSLNGERLFFYHFQGVRELLRGWFDPGLLFYSTPMTVAMRELIYRPYLQRLAVMQARLERSHGIQRRLGYQRLGAGASLRDRWNRWLARRVLPHYRRARGQLLRAGD